MKTQPPNTHDTSTANLQTWFNNVDTIVSVPGGKLELSDSQRRVALLFADGTLLIDLENQTNPQILLVRELARRKGIAITTIKPVAIEIIRQLYGEAEKQFGEPTHKLDQITPMQRDWLALLKEAADLAVSDIHIYVHSFEADIKFRAHGEMRNIRQVEAAYAHELVASAYNMADASDSTYRLYDYQAARISTTSTPLPKGLQAVRLQLNPMGNGGRYMIARLLYAENSWDRENQMSLDSMGLHPQQLRCLANMRLVPEGINIISGPTGSGKSTTLKLVLELLYRERRQMINILTIEDPPEYEIYGAAQLPVTNVDSEEERGMAYRKAITAALRSDPDVIMPGEARDREVINLVFTAAMTGHQVWTSLHANSAMSIFDRLRDQGVDRYKLTDPTLLCGLTAQRLIKKLCPACSQPIDKVELEVLTHSLSGFAEASEGYVEHIRQANLAGCPQCSGGYSGRTILAEAICPDQEFLTLMDSGDRAKALLYWQERLGGITMMEHGWLHMISGDVAPRDVVDLLGPFRGLTPLRRTALINLK
ncbi:GspE/PulE family protein [Yersinia mollaretii]|uniref:GspE/PulE family protein n=1 Tax=Yersinia mollaretii TaxID=33060 RepID=UPI00119E7EFC|nr:ATPase, T2SS/T4P/T4SS family [Yersinia mollaretii]